MNRDQPHPAMCPRTARNPRNVVIGPVRLGDIASLAAALRHVRGDGRHRLAMVELQAPGPGVPGVPGQVRGDMDE